MVFNKAIIFQCFCAVSASLAVFGTGAAIGWSSILKRLVDENIFTEDQKTWIASMHEPGHLLAALPTGILLTRWGPLNCIRLAGLFLFAGWSLILYRISFWIICTARLCFGISMGIAFTVVPLYVGEISNPGLRGALGVIFQSMIYLGHLFEYILVPLIPYFEVAAVSLCIPIAFLIATIVMVDSPYFLLKKGRYNDAGEAYSRLSGEIHLHRIELHLHQMQDMMDESEFSRTVLKEIFMTKNHRYALMIVSVLAIVQRFSGMSAVVAYATSTFPDTAGGLNSYQYTIVFGSITFLFTVVSGVFMDSRGRRPLTLISCAGCCIAEIVTSVYYYSYLNKKSYSWIPLISISSYACFYTLGLGPVVNILQGELFAPSVKGISAALVTVIHATSSFLVTKIVYHFVRQNFGIYLVFAIFASSCLLALIFTYIFVPETKQKTLQEVQRDNDRYNN